MSIFARVQTITSLSDFDQYGSTDARLVQLIGRLPAHLQQRRNEFSESLRELEKDVAEALENGHRLKAKALWARIKAGLDAEDIGQFNDALEELKALEAAKSKPSQGSFTVREAQQAPVRLTEVVMGLSGIPHEALQSLVNRAVNLDEYAIELRETIRQAKLQAIAEPHDAMKAKCREGKEAFDRARKEMHDRLNLSNHADAVAETCLHTLQGTEARKPTQWPTEAEIEAWRQEVEAAKQRLTEARRKQQAANFAHGEARGVYFQAKKEFERAVEIEGEWRMCRDWLDPQPQQAGSLSWTDKETGLAVR